MVLCIIGPSGCGKSSVANELARRGLVQIVPTYTDRPRRAHESGLEHRFVTAEEFGHLEAAGTFVAVAAPFALPYRYGLPRFEDKPDAVTAVVIRAPYLEIVRRLHPTLLCYQIEAPLAFAAQAIGERKSDAGTRLSQFETELDQGRAVADAIFYNSGDNFEQLVQEIETALNQLYIHFEPEI